LTYWLIPAEPARSWFRSLIDDLARRLDAPVFEPHVTLGVSNIADENLGAVLENALQQFEPHRLLVDGLDSSQEFTKTLFVQFQPDALLTKLNEKLRSASASPLEYELNPHLSLVYKRMPPKAKNEIMHSIDLPFTDVEFDSVQAVIIPAKIESRQDIEACSVVATRHLGK
jgi:2'-5' RNA ligase